MDTWRHISECLDSRLMGALKIESCGACVGTGNADAAQLRDIVEASGADCRDYAGVAACLSPGLTPCGVSAPETAPARQQARESLRHFVVIDGCAASKAANGGVAPRRAAHLSIVTIEGERVHQAALPDA